MAGTLHSKALDLLTVLARGWPSEPPPEYHDWVDSGAVVVVFSPELDRAIGVALDWRTVADELDPRNYTSAEDLAETTIAAMDALPPDLRRLIDASPEAQDRIAEAEQAWIASAAARWDQWISEWEEL